MKTCSARPASGRIRLRRTCIGQVAAFLLMIPSLAAGAERIVLTVDKSSRGWEISPFIYGINWGPETNFESYVADLGIPLRRWGGNATTRYNWKLDMTNRAADWFFENLPDSNGIGLPEQSAFNRFFEQNRRLSIETVLTVPIIGWTPKSRQRTCGFSVAKYGPQQQTDPWWPDCGNGVRINGQNVTGNDPSDTSIPIGPEFAQEWIVYLQNRYGPGSSGGIRFCELDNEPDCWQWTHRDVFPDPFSYDDVVDRGIAHAAAVKAADPTMLIMGPVITNWMGYFCSAVDWYSGWSTGPNWVWDGNPIDRNAHEGVPLLRWYLRKMKEHEEATGVRILDYLDIHAYPYEPGLGGAAGDVSLQEKRLNAVRYYWDPSYPVTGGTDQFPGLIPMMRAWIDLEYPGTKLAITEYNFGGMEHINGALTQAEVLGVFGRDQVNLAAVWDPPELTEPGAFAFRIFRNYDGRGAAFGDRGIPAASSDPLKLSVFSSIREADGALTVVVINKSEADTEAGLQVQPALSLPTAARVFRYSSADLTRIVQLPDLPLTSGKLDTVFPAQSITMLEMVRPQPSRRPLSIRSPRGSN